MTAFTWLRSNPSYHARMPSIFAPASRFSKIVATGMRVLRSTHVPLTLPGMLSTAGPETNRAEPSFQILPNLSVRDFAFFAAKANALEENWNTNSASVEITPQMVIGEGGNQSSIYSTSGLISFSYGGEGGIRRR